MAMTEAMKMPVNDDNDYGGDGNMVKAMMVEGVVVVLLMVVVGGTIIIVVVVVVVVTVGRVTCR